jgi:hypothetical protein
MRKLFLIPLLVLLNFYAAPNIVAFFLVASAFGQNMNGANSISYPNDTVTGTQQAYLAIVNTAGNAITATSSNTNVYVYIVTSATATSGTAFLAITGTAPCIMDTAIGSGGAGYYVIASTTNPGYCHPQAAAPAAGTGIVGTLAVQATSVGVNARVLVNPSIQGGGGGGGGSPTGSAGGDLSGSYPNPGVAKINGNTPGGTCTNQVVVSITTSAQPSCGTVTSAFVDATVVTTSTAGAGDLGGTYPAPTVTNGSHITNNSIPNSGLVNPSTAVNGQTCTLGAVCTIPFQTNATPNTSQVGVNFKTSTANVDGLIATPKNVLTNGEQVEISGPVNMAAGGSVPSGQTFTVQSGGTLTCAGGATCPSNSLPSGGLGQPYVNTNGSTGGATSPLEIDVSQMSGATADVKLNNANAYAITQQINRVNAASLIGNQTIAAEVEIGQLAAPTMTFSVGGGIYGNGVYKGSYTLTSPTVTGETTSSSEGTVTTSGCSSNCTITMDIPPYLGTATSYSPYLTVANGGSWSEDMCAANANTSVASNAAITAACSGAAINQNNQGGAVAMIPPGNGLWKVTITDGVSCGLKFHDYSSFLGEESGEGRSWYVQSNSSSTSVDSLICTDKNAKNGAGYYMLRGLAAADVAGDTIANGVITIRNTYDTSIFDSPHAGTHTNVPGIFIDHVCCSTTLISPQVEGATAGQPLVIGTNDSNGIVTSLNIIGGSFVHAALGEPDIAITGTTAQQMHDINFIGSTYLECTVSNQSADLIQIGTLAGLPGPVHFDSVSVGIGTCPGVTGYLFNVGVGGSAVGNFSVDHVFNGQVTNLFRYPANTSLNVTGVSVNSTYPRWVIDTNNPETFNTAVTMNGTLNGPQSILSGGAAPTIASGFGTSPSVARQNGTWAFRINVGTGGSATGGVITMPVNVINAWNCYVQNVTAHAGNRADDTVETATSNTTVTVQNQTKSTGAAVAWTAGDVIALQCFGSGQ